MLATAPEPVTVEVPRDLLWLLEGAGLTPTRISRGDPARVRATRQLTLPDVIGPGLRLLICGLNPSVYAATAGVNFARPGNRFWPAARAAGIVSVDRDPWHALAHHGTGFTDLVKRATVAASALTVDEYRAGVRRLELVVETFAPRAVCFVGLTGWREAVDRHAVAGVQPHGFAGAAAYLMPNTSGLNAHTKPADFARHLRAAAAL